MGKLREYAQEILNLYNYYNGAIIFDTNAFAVYYYNNSPDVNNMTKEDVVGKHISQIYPELVMEDSTIMEAINKGIPTANMEQKIKTFKGQELNEINTTIPIFDRDVIIGAVEVSKYVFGDQKHQNIYISPMSTEKQRKLYTIDDIVSNCSSMEVLKRKMVKVSGNDSSVLIYGSTGTGKEMVAEAIHTGGKRRDKKFVSQNCAAIPSTLLESILFGSIKGGFTGAENRMGLLESANGGTIFLDEINNLDISLQAKILKAIEEQKVTRVGAFDSVLIDVRIIAATNQDPWELVKSSKLRKDLYYRLRVVQIDLPTLVERDKDIEVLTNHFINKYNQRMKKNILGLDEATKYFFAKYGWPGNVRELCNTIEGALNFAEGNLISLDDISWYGTNEQKNNEFESNFIKNQRGSLKEMVWKYEKTLIENVILDSTDLNEAAKKLGISRQNLNHKIKRCNHQINITNFTSK